MNEVKAILFDFGGTLDNDGREWSDRTYQHVCQKRGQVEQQEFFRCLAQACDTLGTLADTRQLSLLGTIERICQHLKILLDENSSEKGSPWDPTEVAGAFEAEARSYIERNRSLLEKLKQNYRLGVISNNWGNTEGWCRDYALTDYFEVRVDSELVGSAKPDSKIFLVALEQMKLSARECVYVGDRFDWDMEGAYRVGMKPVWLRGAHRQECPNESILAGWIDKLSELPVLLNGAADKQ